MTICPKYDDLISRQAAIDLLKKWSDGYDYIETETESAINDFQHLPSAQPERKVGEWVEEGGMLMCSECGDVWGTEQFDEVMSFNYCPYCGAEMKGEE